MNCALEARAMSRASVVLPVPGGPQKISECSCPVAMLADKGLPGPSRCCWPTNSPSERSEEHTSELQSQSNLVCRLLLEKKKKPCPADVDPVYDYPPSAHSEHRLRPRRYV